MALPLVLALQAQLTAAAVRIHVARDSARVEAEFRLEAPGDSAHLVLIRLPGQTIRWAADATAERTEEPGLTRLAVAPAARIRVSYVVAGRLDRIPLPVPEAPALPGADRVTIIVEGLQPARLDDAFPRLVAGTVGTARAELANVPSLVRLPPAGAGRFLSGGVEAFVILLVAASAGWLFRLRRARSRGPPP